MCFECPKGQNQPAARRTFCADCDAGRASTALGEAECDLCPAGEFGDIPGLSACKPCPRGKISDTPTDLSLNLGCVNCTAGRFAATTRTLGSLCTACDAGRYNNQPGTKRVYVCVPCLMLVTNLVSPPLRPQFLHPMQCRRVPEGQWADSV